MNTIYNEEFLKTSTEKIKNIVRLKREKKTIEAAKAELDLANYKVAYYEQFYDPNEATSSHKKIHEDDLYWALMNRANIRDKCMDMGIYE